MTAAGYKRNQVEWALWQVFSGGRFGKQKPLPVFRTRIKKLLDLDREIEGYEFSDQRHARYAFVNEAPEGQGRDLTFSGFDVFCLSLGLDLLDSGFKQSEVVFYMKHSRSVLKSVHKYASNNPAYGGVPLSRSELPDEPTMTKDGVRFRDNRVFMAVTKLDLTEAWPADLGTKRMRKPIISRPKFYYGQDDLFDPLERLNHQWRKVLIIEIAEMITLLEEYLQDAPVTTRGRG